jgi:hypothetical protein
MVINIITEPGAYKLFGNQNHLFRSTDQHIVQICNIFHAWYKSLPSHSPWLDNLLISAQEQKLGSSSLCSFHHPHVASFLLDILLNTLFGTVNICWVLSVQDVALHCRLQMLTT